MIRAAVLGATGYAGSLLTSLLSTHKEVEIRYLASHSYSGQKFSDIYPKTRGMCDIVLQEDDIEKAKENSDVIFLSLPAGFSSKLVTKDVLRKCVVIDLGPDFRLKSKEEYEKWYKTETCDEEMLKTAVYGLPEIHREEIKGKRLIANPGCYTTCSVLTLHPLLKNNLIDKDTIIIDAKSGASGAGRSERVSSLFCEVNESAKPYSIASHRHTPEIEQELSASAGDKLKVQFTPHLIPMNRGILTTCYAKVRKGVSEEDVKNAYSMYKNESFIRLLSAAPETKNVTNTNFTDIYTKIDLRTGNIIAIGALDNLVKGAAGQALQNMNIIFSLDETEGLSLVSGSF